MCASVGPEPVAGVGKGRIEDGFQHLEDHLLNQTIHHHGNAQLALSSARLGDLHSTHGLGPVGPIQQGSRQRRVVSPQPVGQFVHGHAVHAWLALIGTNSPVCAQKVLRVAYLLHQTNCQGSLWVECRERLPPSMRCRAGSARLVAAVVLMAFLLLRVPRNLPSAPCIKDLALRPVRLSGRRWRACALATVRRSNCTCSFPAYSFHEDSRFRGAIEGINWIKFTSPYSPYSLVSGNCRQPPLPA